MPELPDLQVFSSNLDKTLAGKKIAKVIASGSRIKKSGKAISDALENQEIKKIYREGKELRFLFANKVILGMHLMLHGKLELLEEKQKPKHAVLELRFKDGSGLALTDFQGMAHVSLNPASPKAPDALSKKITAAFLQEKLSGSRSSIKNFLIDQDMIQGIGNAYADEILWSARISPFSICYKIPKPAITKFAASIRSVLTNAEKQIRKENPEIIAGELRDFLKIHNPQLKETATGFPILTEPSSGRKTYYSEEQKLYN
jgi:formamidopyrimidine-DNA glycosylase